MMECIRILGENLLSKNKDREEALLKGFSMKIPFISKKDGSPFYELQINLNRTKNLIELRKKEISDNILAFEKMAANEPRIYPNTNNLSYLLTSIPDIIQYIEKYSLDKENEEYKKLKEVFIVLKNNFCKNFKEGTKTKVILDESKLNKNLFNETILQSISKAKNINKDLRKIWSDLIKLKFNLSNKEFNKIKIFSLTIDGQRFEETNFGNIYKKLLFHWRITRNFNEDKKISKCHLCNQITEVTGKIDIPFKFYITDKKSFFPGFSKKNAYKSFSLCKKCYEELVYGIFFITKELKSSINNLPYYIIPKNPEFLKNEEEIIFIKRILNKLPEHEDEFFEKNVELIKRIKRKNLFFDFLFYEKSQSAFNVLYYTSNINLNYLIKIKQSLKNINQLNKNKICLNDFYFLFFKNKKNKEVQKKELINLLNNIYKNRSIKFLYLLRRFIENNKTQFLVSSKESNYYVINILKMNTLLEFLFDSNFLKNIGVIKIETVLKLKNEGIKKYFETHNKVYEDDEKKGLFILGYLIGEIKKKQEKGNIMALLNYEGIRPNRVIYLISRIAEQLELKDLMKSNKNEFGLMKEYLEDIIDSKLKKEEIVFYILSGIAFSSVYYKNKKQEVNQNE